MNTIDKHLGNVQIDFANALVSDSGPYRTYLSYEGDELISRTVQNTQSIVAENARLRQEDLWRRADSFKPYARIPQALWMQWEAMGITDDPKSLLAAIELMKDEVKVTNKKF